MILFDSHCHLDDQIYDKDIEAVIKRMNEAGVDPFMVERTVGRTLPTKMMSVYNQASYESERIKAMEKLTTHIKEVLDG